MQQAVKNPAIKAWKHLLSGFVVWSLSWHSSGLKKHSILEETRIWPSKAHFYRSLARGKYRISFSTLSFPRGLNSYLNNTLALIILFINNFWTIPWVAIFPNGKQTSERAPKTVISLIARCFLLFSYISELKLAKNFIKYPLTKVLKLLIIYINNLQALKTQQTSFLRGKSPWQAKPQNPSPPKENPFPGGPATPA